jgi:copper resistance protein C
VLSLLLAVLSSLATAVAATAHAALRSMTPAAGSTVTTAPTKVVLTYNEAISSSFATVTVTDQDGDTVSSGRPAVAGKTVTQKLSAVGSGRYTVAFRVVSEDGHPISQRLVFSVDLPTATSATPPTTATEPPASPTSAAASAAPTPAPTPGDSDDGTASTALAWGVGAAAFAVVAVGAVAWARRRQTSE